MGSVGDSVAKEQLLSRREQSVRLVKISKSYEETTALKEMTVRDPTQHGL